MPHWPDLVEHFLEDEKVLVVHHAVHVQPDKVVR
jgi:hypothetical protein